MSRIGKLPVNLPAGGTGEVSADNVVSVKGPLGTLSQKVDSDIKVEVGTHKDVHTGNEAPAVLVSRPTNQPRHRSLHGLYRALINNMVVGVSKGYEIKQELVGVGFKAEVKGQILEMSLGYSHDTHFMLPKEVTATAVTEKKGSSAARSLPRSVRCASRSRTRARVSSSSANSCVARRVNQQVLNSK